MMTSKLRYSAEGQKLFKGMRSIDVAGPSKTIIPPCSCPSYAHPREAWRVNVATGDVTATKIKALLASGKQCPPVRSGHQSGIAAGVAQRILIC
jgi:hypothetical protein